MNIIKAIFRVIVGAIFGLASGIALIPATAAFASERGSSDTSWMTFVVIAVGAALGFFAPTIRRTFGRGFLLLGVSVFALPLSVMLLSGRVTSDMIAESAADDRGMAAVGGTIAGTMMTGAAAFIGFFLGAIFLIIGLVLALGGRREVVVVHQNATGGASYAARPPQPEQPMIDATRRRPLDASVAPSPQLSPEQRVEPKF